MKEVSGSGRLELETLRKMCSTYFKIEDIAKKTRKVEWVWTRTVFYRLALDEGYSLTSVGKFTGGRDHATVLHGKNVFADLFNQVDFKMYKDGYLHLKMEVDASKDDNQNLTDFMLRFKDEIKDMSGTEYLFFKAELLKSLGKHVEARNEKNNAISSEISDTGKYIFTGGEGI